ncbi:2-keto-4-pentenoate hydratase [Micromonospora sp. HUAS LYJ1]|uniref:2-keto-4-pentenoate hydratase n=1 Tax=Micromonospora sp. HUAS LYJ1 TaxID=3061626 RepID=UPI0026732AF5|nr:fumarylacetoacetate hydrolase family protein [Micromonospora sp. HUAS LYJ1]WKU02967.1 fumarylacetoacetate hydrolase family protein [Micromonospora sp. HUAS LYJ1]
MSGTGGSPALAEHDTERMAMALYQARRERVPIAPFTDACPTLDAAGGYAVQRRLTDLLVSDGERVIGYKAGLTSAPMQEMFGVDAPDYGPVFASTVRPDGTRVARDDFISPKVEAEIVFRLASPLAGPGVTVEQARAAIGEVVAGLEVVDSRITDWRIRLGDTIADLASNGAAVLGRPVRARPDLDYRLVRMAFRRNGELVASGRGADALGDPVAVVALLANLLGENGVTLEAGQLIMTGALHAAVPLRPGDTYTAEFDQLGAVTLHVAHE